MEKPKSINFPEMGIYLSYWPMKIFIIFSISLFVSACGGGGSSSSGGAHPNDSQKAPNCLVRQESHPVFVVAFRNSCDQEINVRFILPGVEQGPVLELDPRQTAGSRDNPNTTFIACFTPFIPNRTDDDGSFICDG